MDMRCIQNNIVLLSSQNIYHLLITLTRFGVPDYFNSTIDPTIIDEPSVKNVFSSKEKMNKTFPQ